MKAQQTGVYLRKEVLPEEGDESEGEQAEGQEERTKMPRCSRVVSSKAW